MLLVQIHILFPLIMALSCVFNNLVLKSSPYFQFKNLTHLCKYFMLYQIKQVVIFVIQVIYNVFIYSCLKCINTHQWLYIGHGETRHATEQVLTFWTLKVS